MPKIWTCLTCGDILNPEEEIDTHICVPIIHDDISRKRGEDALDQAYERNRCGY